MLTTDAPAGPVTHPPNLRARQIAPDLWGCDHVDSAGNRWSVCECEHDSEAEALACAPRILDKHGRDAFDTYNHAVGGVTWDGKPIPGWDQVTDKVRDGWRMAGLSARKGHTIR